MSSIDDPSSPNPPIIPTPLAPAGPSVGVLDSRPIVQPPTSPPEQFQLDEAAGTTKSDELPPVVSSHTILNGNPSLRSMTDGAVTQVSSTPLPLRTVDPATYLSQWWDVPQPLRQPPPFNPGVVPTTKVVADFGAPLEFTAAVAGSTPLPLKDPPNHVALSARSMAMATGRAAINAREGAFVNGGEPADLIAERSKFETLEARVAVLEATLTARPAGVALAPRPPGIGHNSGIYLDEDLNVDEASIQNLIALLKVPRATAPSDLEKLAEAAKVADPSINKWQERVDTFVTNVIKGAAIQAGKEIAQQLLHASWVQSVFSALQSVFEAIKDLFF
jgi:hypothetical protein